MAYSFKELLAGDELIVSIQEEVTDYIFRVEIRPEETDEQDVWGGQQASHQELGQYESSRAQNEAAVNRNLSGGAVKPIRRTEKKVGRNEACPCGSGRKYKKCHGSAV